MAVRLTEQPSLYDHLEKKSVAELLRDINTEDKKVPLAIEAVLPDIERLVNAIEAQIRAGGRFFWLGAGTGGKLGVLDVLEVPNTYGVDPEIWQAVLAGGNENLVLDLEEAEDDTEEGWRTLSEKHHVTPKDIVVGISASGCTPYVLAAMKACKEHGIPCGSICNNPESPISAWVDYPIEIVMGPEFITGSTRMKSGTSQKLRPRGGQPDGLRQPDQQQGRRPSHPHDGGAEPAARVRFLRERHQEVRRPQEGRAVPA